MAWSPDDNRLASVGAGGACYQWDIIAGVKIAHEEYVDKQKNYCCVQFCSSSSSAYGVVVRSLDGKIQHIQVWAVLLLLHSGCYTCVLSVLLFVPFFPVCLQSHWQHGHLSKSCCNDAGVAPCCCKTSCVLSRLGL